MESMGLGGCEAGELLVKADGFSGLLFALIWLFVKTIFLFPELEYGTKIRIKDNTSKFFYENYIIKHKICDFS